ncbi:MAG: acetyl-CoA synthase subunit gamma [Verrucomicrobia bacterium]|nr:MAG: acetyl-CoA synthase subunit gamma [Verrucomicrobiota bacterium]
MRSDHQATALEPCGHVTAEWTIRNWLGALGVRLNLRRMHYRVTPGLYALGKPGPDAPVFVSANYKLSFDHLRQALVGLDGWILVLDTQGVNVWCAAGKGTFGTAELIGKIRECRLLERVTHRRLIVPQLGASGIAAHEVRKQSGFAVIYGPVYAANLPAFLQAKLHATPAMRRVHFRWYERLVVAPVEIALYRRELFLGGLALAILACLPTAGASWAMLGQRSGTVFLLWLVTSGLAIFLGPLLLPWLPTRAFSIKGASLGLALALCSLGLLGPDWTRLRSAAWVLLLSTAASYLLLNFTGSTTFTSPSGVRREVRLALPVQIVAGVVGLTAWTAAGFLPTW